MKFKVRYKRASGECSVVVRSDKGAELDYADASRMEAGAASVLLPLTYELQGKAYQLSYLASGHVPLDEFAAQPMRSAQFHAILMSFLQLLEECTAKHFDLPRVMFDPRCLMFSPRENVLRFVYVPLKSFVDESSSIDAALVYACERAQLTRPEDKLLAATVRNFAKLTPLFSELDYRALLVRQGVCASEQGQDGGRGAAKRRSLHPTTDRVSHQVKAYGYDFVHEQQRRATLKDTDFFELGAGKVFGDGPIPSSQRLRLVNRARDAIWMLSEGANTIGRVPKCSILLDDNTKVSRRHATLTVKGTDCTVRDENSRNGVMLNGSRIPAARDVALSRGDTLTIGGEDFELV